MKNPKVIIMDEPTLGIDPEGMRELLNLIRELAEEDGRTILVSSHQLYQIQQICDRVGIFVEGQLIACGKIEEMAGQMHRDGHYVLEVAGLPDNDGFVEMLKSLGNVNEVKRDGAVYLVDSRSDVKRELLRKALNGGFTLTHIRQRDQDLDEIYHLFFEKEGEDHGTASGTL